MVLMIHFIPFIPSDSEDEIVTVDEVSLNNTKAVHYKPTSINNLQHNQLNTTDDLNHSSSTQRLISDAMVQLI